MSDTFLTPEEMAELSGIRKGRRGRTREQLQIDWLRTTGIPFWPNARGRPMVARVAIEGRPATTPAEPPRAKWQPKVVIPKR